MLRSSHIWDGIWVWHIKMCLDAGVNAGGCPRVVQEQASACCMRGLPGQELHMIFPSGLSHNYS